MTTNDSIRRPYSRQPHPKHPGIYAIVHVESGRRYIGSAQNIYRRWRNHKSELRRGIHLSRYLQNSWNKYGELAFRFEVVEMCLKDPVMLAAREQHWLNKLKGNLFNLRDQADPAFGVPRTPEQNAAASKRMMGNKCGEGTHYHGHLTEDDVREILRRYATGEARETIAADFKTHRVNISRIASRKIWWRVEVDPEIDAACRERTKHRARGKKNAGAKLADHIDEIKHMISQGIKSSSIANHFGVTPNAISQIKRGKSYNY